MTVATKHSVIRLLKYHVHHQLYMLSLGYARNILMKIFTQVSLQMQYIPEIQSALLASCSFTIKSAKYSSENIYTRIHMQQSPQQEQRAICQAYYVSNDITTRPSVIQVAEISCPTVLFKIIYVKNLHIFFKIIYVGIPLKEERATREQSPNARTQKTKEKSQNTQFNKVRQFSYVLGAKKGRDLIQIIKLPTT